MSHNKKDVVADAEEAAADKEYEGTVMEKNIKWESYEQSGLLSAKELGMMRDYDKEPLDSQDDLLWEQGEEYASMFVKALDNIRESDAVQYLLTMVDSLLQRDPKRASFFHKCPNNPYSPLMRILSRENNEYTLAKACQILSIILSSNPEEKCPDLADFLKWVTTRVGSPATKGRALIHSLSALKDVLKRPEAQMMFIKYGGLKSLTTHLKKETQNTQLLYLVGFCIWLLSYNEEARGHLKACDVVRKLIEIVRLVMREKVVRICFCTLANLLNKEKFNEEMIAHGLVKQLDVLAARKWKDADLIVDIKRIQHVLSAAVEELSNFDIYETEVKSGHLTWTPVHCEKFWRENSAKFEDGNFLLIKTLISLLDEREEDTTLEVACYDLGEFARFYPDGRRLLQGLGGKNKLMAQMSSPYPKVAKQALLSVQKLLVGNWEFLEKSN